MKQVDVWNAIFIEAPVLIVYGNNAMLLRKNAWDNKLLIGQAHNYTDKYKARIKVSMSEVKSCKYLE